MKTEPTQDQLTQILNGLDHCHVGESKREFLRVWIRDYVAVKTAKTLEDAEERVVTLYEEAEPPYLVEIAAAIRGI